MSLPHLVEGSSPGTTPIIIQYHMKDNTISYESLIGR
jgi:hypothetical protein